MDDRIQVGAIVAVNDGCQIKDDTIRASCNHLFETLGVHEGYWKVNQMAGAIQAGPSNLLLTFQGTASKIPGKSMKQRILEDNNVFSYLNKLWGLQVSFCTGVARRVPLRVLMADLLPLFAGRDPRHKRLWDALEAKASVISSLSAPDQTWLELLEDSALELLAQLMLDILKALDPTGIDATSKHMIVAWIHQESIKCVRLNCSHEQNSWVRVLADSVDCATFAYITATCLVTHKVPCRGPAFLWDNTSPLLETGVFGLQKQANKSRPLEHKEIYFFRKMDSLLQVTVEKEPGSTEVRLYVRPSMIPGKFRERMSRLRDSKAAQRIIRERELFDEPKSEDVAILTTLERRI